MSEPSPKSDALVDRLYAGVGFPQALPSLVSELCIALGAQQGLIQTSAATNDHRGVNLVAHGVPLQSLVEYHVHFEQEDVWTRAAMERGLLYEGSVARGAELVPPTVLRTTRFWREFLARHQVADMISGVLEAPDTRRSPPTVITFHRIGDQVPFSREDEDRLRALLPHIRRVLRLQRKLAPQLALGQSLKEMLEASSLPLALVDASGHPLSLNRAATAAISAAELLRLGGKGALQWRLDQKGWQDIEPALQLLRARSGVEQLLLADAGSGCMASMLGVRNPLHGAELFSAACACLSLRPIHLERDAEAVRARFRLTASEMNVALALWRGHDAENIAARGGIKLSTVRSHIAGLLSKTQSDRQLLMLARLEGRW